jgi:hypothetical protein
MEKCPEDYRENCQKYPARCPVCAAGYGSKTLFYIPIDETLSPHPHAEVLKSQKRRGAKARHKGHNDEKKSLARLANRLVKGTIGSGMVCGDGDATLLDIGQVEVKSRSNIGITKAEYDKGVKQGVKVWQIVTPHGTFYVLPEDTFVNITQNFIHAQS